MQRVYGKCYTFLTPQELVSSKVYSLTFTLKMAGVVYPHHPGQFQSQDTRNMLPVEPNTYYFVPSNHKVLSSFIYNAQACQKFFQVAKSLTLPKTGNSSFKTTCSDSITWTYDDCIYRATAERVRQKYGCVMPYFNKFNMEDTCQMQNFSVEKNKEFLEYFEGK